MRRARQFALLATAAAAACLSLTGCGDTRSPRIDLTLDHSETSSAALSFDNDRALIDVTDSRGINGLTAQLTAGQWPPTVTIRLRLQGLEQLEIAYDNITLATGRSSNESPDPPLMLTVTDDQGNAQTASPSADIYYPDIRRTADGFEIDLPPHFFAEEHASFSMRWIDFYR